MEGQKILGSTVSLDHARNPILLRASVHVWRSPQRRVGREYSRANLVVDAISNYHGLIVFKQVRNVFTGGPSDIAMNDHEVHLPHDCIEVLEWDHIDVPGENDGYSHVARTSLDLPVASDLLYFIGRGRLSHGIVRFVDSEAQDSDQASVEVTFLYNEHELSDHLKICRLHKEDSKNGVGIFVSPLFGG